MLKCCCCFFLFISMLTLGVHSACNNTLIGSGFLPLIIYSLEILRIEDRQIRKRSFMKPGSTERLIRLCFTGLKSQSLSRLFYQDRVIESHVHSLSKKIKKKHLVYLHFHHSRRSRKRWNLATFLLRHHTMWNIAPLIHMPLQISWGTAPMTVVVNSMKTSHKTAESPW